MTAFGDSAYSYRYPFTSIYICDLQRSFDYKCKCILLFCLCLFFLHLWFFSSHFLQSYKLLACAIYILRHRHNWFLMNISLFLSALFVPCLRIGLWLPCCSPCARAHLHYGSCSACAWHTSCGNHLPQSQRDGQRVNCDSVFYGIFELNFFLFFKVNCFVPHHK